LQPAFIEIEPIADLLSGEKNISKIVVVNIPDRYTCTIVDVIKINNIKSVILYNCVIEFDTRSGWINSRE